MVHELVLEAGAGATVAEEGAAAVEVEDEVEVDAVAATVMAMAEAEAVAGGEEAVTTTINAASCQRQLQIPPLGSAVIMTTG